jgi:hypothetical protein
MTPRVDPVDSLPGFATLVSEWNVALARSDGASVFRTHDSLSGSWSFLAPGWKLLILVPQNSARFAGALGELGGRHAADFSWERTARETISVFERIAGRG